MTAALICLLLTVGPPLAQARKELEAGKIDEVFLALENQKLPTEDRLPAAEVLVRASRSALEKKDPVMAVSLAELALKVSPENPAALEACSRSSRAVEQFEQAEKYADRWVRADSKNPESHVLRAELAIEAADWQVAINQLSKVKATGALADKVATIRQRAQSELSDRKTAVTTIANLEKTLTAAAVEAKRGTGTRAVPAANRNEVIVYSTSWCGYCRKAKAWLTQRGVSFIEKDIEKDKEAEVELATKAAAAGVTPNGVPVIDARGTLVLGFDPAKLEKLL